MRHLRRYLPFFFQKYSYTINAHPSINFDLLHVSYQNRLFLADLLWLADKKPGHGLLCVHDAGKMASH